MQIVISFDDASGIKRLSIKNGSITPHTLTIHLLTAIKHYYPDIGKPKEDTFIPLSGIQIATLVELNPPSLYDEFASIAIEVVSRPCHSFRRTYAAMCDFHDLPYREEVSWVFNVVYHVRIVLI